MTNDMHAYIGKTYKVRKLAAATAAGEGVSLTGNVEVTGWVREDRDAEGGKMGAYCTIVPIPQREQSETRLPAYEALTCNPFDLIEQIAPRKASEDAAADADQDGQR